MVQIKRQARVAANLLLTLIYVSVFAPGNGAAQAAEVTPARIAAGEPDNWLTFFGNYQAWSYSSLSQINRRTVKSLAPVWSFATGEKGMSATPLVVDGVMYVAAPRNRIFALDAATGRQLWTYERAFPEGRVARTTFGMAAGYGLIFFGTVDNHLVALDAATGREVWAVQIEDPKQCGCGPAFAPLLVKDKIVMGVRGEVAHRSYINAFDARTGKHAWRFWTVPGPGEFGHETWPAELWKIGGGSSWFAGSYDPDLNLIYWGIGNPAPLLGSTWPGKKLFTNSLVALDADTGVLKWHFQENPEDVLDLDSATEPVLIDAPVKGVMRKLVVHPTKGGFNYVLDRATGAYLGAYPHSDTITWTKGLDQNGLPIAPERLTPHEDKLICPSVNGSRAANSSTYSPHTGLWTTTSYESCAMERAIDPGQPVEGQLYNAGSQVSVVSPTSKPHIAAFDPVTGRKVWSHETRGLNVSSLLSTGGDLIFGGDLFGNAWALDGRSGKKIWSFNMGGGVTNKPISYAVNGRQYIAVGAGAFGAGLGLTLRLWPELKAEMPPVGSSIFVFALPQRGKGGTP